MYAKKINICFIACVETLEAMLTNYHEILRPEIDEVSPNSSAKLWILQDMIDAIDTLKDQLEKPINKKIIYANGEVKRVLSQKKIFIIRLIYSSLKINYQPINISISLSGIFNILYVV